MADIKNYLKEKEKREQNQVTYKEKIKKHKLTSLYRIFLVLAVLIAIVVLIYVQYERHIYTDYDIVGTVERENASDALDIRLGDSILTYSKDGAHCTDAKGNVTWNRTYEIQDIKMATCRNMVAIGSYNERSIYLGSTDEQLGEISTTMPLRDLAVSETGRVTAVLADTDATWINTYNAEGEHIYSAQTHMDNSGYPGAVSLSPNGELLAVSYVYIDAGVLKTNVAFYNFGPVGANQNDYMVGGHTYHDMLVPMLQFMNNETMFAVGDSRLMFFKGAQKPVSAQEYILDQEIQSVFYNEEYVGLVFLADDAAEKYRMDVYNVKSEKVGSFYFDIDYNDIFFDKDMFVVYNETECMIMTLAGVEKFNGHFTKTVDLMLPTSAAYKYLLVTEGTIDTIQLR
uniref:DUF5711 family protein n=1 Tax=Acetatifactor sp. TaxID=1872090 RepID=UPI0040560919